MVFWSLSSSSIVDTAIQWRRGHFPPLPAAPRSQPVAETRDQLRMWGHVYYGDAKTADAFVIARSLRRQSISSLDETASAGLRKFGSPQRRIPNRLTVRAIVRPRALERQSFLMQRNFDLDELRATVPDISSPSSLSVSSTGIQHHPSTSGLRISPRPYIGARRPSSIKSADLLYGQGSTASVSVDHASLIRDAKAVPVHLRYARGYLPILAALLVSGHVRERDIIYLPLPHAAAWPQTVRYIYTGQGELTEATRENILYLAGKV
ncbi:hypothetical protein BJ170DRAFT_419054 [Xylariales sp. AK1849]|nr:hypothetical protein BJ170DRAFT_419054 [Xylariales sp. AK1849]